VFEFQGLVESTSEFMVWLFLLLTLTAVNKNWGVEMVYVV